MNEMTKEKIAREIAECSQRLYAISLTNVYGMKTDDLALLQEQKMDAERRLYLAMEAKRKYVEAPAAGL